MLNDILINWSPYETRVALIENASVHELYMERAMDRGHVGNIYLGRVIRVLPGMQAAFIDIGLEKAGFLHATALLTQQAANPPTPIEKTLFEGQSIMVQVVKEPVGSKGALLTSNISLAGRALVLLPRSSHIGVSQKIPSPRREALRLKLESLSESDEGYILRTNGENANDQELQEDVNYLRKIWEHLRKMALSVSTPSLLYQDLNLLMRVLRDLVNENTQAVRIDSQEQFEAMAQFGANYMPTVVSKLAHYQGERPIFDLFNVNEEINASLGQRVELKSGGHLIIDHTEALTTIDINTGAFVGTRNFGETIFKTNLEATTAIARQLRLRNLGGIIVVDFIDMELAEHREGVLDSLKKQLQKDHVKTTVGVFSDLGLVELTRKRTRDSLTNALCETCPQCAGSGHIKTARTIVYDIFREVLLEAKQFSPKEMHIIANPKVIGLLLDEEQTYLVMLSDFIKKPIFLINDSAFAQTQYEIVLV